MKRMPSFGSRLLIWLNRICRRLTVELVASRIPTEPPLTRRKSSNSSKVSIATCSRSWEAFSLWGSKNSADCSIFSALGSLVNSAISASWTGSTPFRRICAAWVGGSITLAIDSVRTTLLRCVFFGDWGGDPNPSALLAATRLRLPTLKIWVSCCCHDRYLWIFFVM